QQINLQLVGAELVIRGLVNAVTEEDARFIILPGADGMVIQLDHRRKVVKAAHLFRAWHGGEVIAKLRVGGGAGGGGQAVIGVAAHDGEQVDAARRAV